MKKWIFRLSVLSLVTFTFGAMAETCIPQSEMQEIARNFSQFEEYSHSDYCLDGSEISNLLDSLLFMRKTSFSNPMPPSADELFSGRFESDWYGYFTGRISKITIDRGCPKGVGAYVYGYFDQTMYVCTMMLTSDFTSLDRASVFMHEARHIDGFPHTTCHEGPREGIRGACDFQISDGGSYAVSVETYAQIAKYATEVHPALRAYSRAAAVTYSDEAFVHTPSIDRTKGLVVLDNSKQFFKVSKSGAGQMKVEALGFAPSLGRVVPRGQHLILFPTAADQPAGYIFPRGEGQISQQAGELARRFNQLSSEERAHVADSHIGAQWMAQINSKGLELFCERASDRSEVLPLPAGKVALGFLYLQGYDRGSHEVVISFADGSLAKAGCNPSFGPFVEEMNQSFSTPLKRAYKVDGTVWGIDQQGQIYEVQNNQLVPFQSKDLNFSVEIAPYEAFDFFDSL